MVKHKLTKKELQEPFAMTIGRLTTAIKYPGNTSQERTLALLKKINDQAAHIMFILEQDDKPIDIFDVAKPYQQV